MAVSSERGDGTLRSIKSVEILFLPAESLSASQERFCSMESVSNPDFIRMSNLNL
jgi:hypothetical protein